MSKAWKNIDTKTVEGFGREWASYDQLDLDAEEYGRLFDAYFSIFPFEELSPDSEGFDVGCGSGRWSAGVVNRVGRLHCIDASPAALNVARRRLQGHPGAFIHLASVDSMPLEDGSQDFGYSLGVLHHIPDTQAALCDCVRKLKPGAPFLVYLYYAFDNRPLWFRSLWQVSNLGRKLISRLPFRLRQGLTSIIAASIYWPAAMTARIAETNGMDVENFPLSAYRTSSFYTMRTDALDRFGTRLEQRFTRDQIECLMSEAGLEEIEFRDGPPYWVACGRKRR